jgi:hypothetical protein
VKIKSVFTTVFVVVLFVAALAVTWSLARATPVETVAESSNNQVITAVEREEQIVLLSAATQGISEETRSSTLFGRNVPGSGRTEFVQYSYSAKIGIEGGDVSIEDTGENEFLITVPEFIVIGNSDAEFKTVLDNAGVLGAMTEKIDTADTISEILNGETMAKEVIALNRSLLEDQARLFYTGVINGVDDSATIEFAFS